MTGFRTPRTLKARLQRSRPCSRRSDHGTRQPRQLVCALWAEDTTGRGHRQPAPV